MEECVQSSTYGECASCSIPPAVKVTSRVRGVAARNNLVSCSFFLNWFKWQRQLASFPFSLFLDLFFSPEVNGKDSIGVKLSHMKTGGYPGKLDLPLSLCK